MNVGIKFCGLIFMLFMLLSKTFAIDNCCLIGNNRLIQLIKSKYYSESKFKNSTYFWGIGIFILNKSNSNEAFVITPLFFHLGSKIAKEIAIKIDIRKIKNDVLKIISTPEENLNLEISDMGKNFMILKSKNVYKFLPLKNIKNYLKLKNYNDFEKDSRIYYTVPSEDKLDDLHIVYESGNERKEFVFTNLPEKPIVPVEEVEKLGKKQEIKPKKTIMSQISSFFGFFTKHEEVKNEGYDYVDEHTKLKEKIY